MADQYTRQDPTTQYPQPPFGESDDGITGYLPDLERDVRGPLGRAGYGPRPIAALGEGLGG